MALPDIWRGESSLFRDPFREISRLQRQIDRMFNDFLSPFESWGSPLPIGWSEPVGRFSRTFSPSCDITEKDDHYELHFDLPGVKKDDLKIEVTDNQLVVSGERKEEHEDKERKYSERFHGSFSRSFTLPSGVKPEDVKADYTDGVLRVSVPKGESSKSYQIQIGEGGTRQIPSGLTQGEGEKEAKAGKKPAGEKGEKVA